MKHIHTGEDKHREFGLIAAKYLETLQRSNEQLVKLAALLQKQQKGGPLIQILEHQQVLYPPSL